jgi:hypothetical protein
MLLKIQGVNARLSKTEMMVNYNPEELVFVPGPVVRVLSFTLDLRPLTFDFP